MRNASVLLIAFTLVYLGPVVWFFSRAAFRSPLELTLPALGAIAWFVLALMSEIEKRFGVTVLMDSGVEQRSALRSVVLPASELAGYSTASSTTHVLLHSKEASLPSVLVDRRILDERENLDWLMALPNLDYASPSARRPHPSSFEWLPLAALVMGWISATAILAQFLVGVEVAAWIHAVSVSAVWSICLLTPRRARLTMTSSVEDPRISFWPSVFLPVFLFMSAEVAQRYAFILECQLLVIAAVILLCARDERLRNDFQGIVAHFLVGMTVINVIVSAIG
jgi:hypothetical protein